MADGRDDPRLRFGPSLFVHLLPVAGLLLLLFPVPGLASRWGRDADPIGDRILSALAGACLLFVWPVFAETWLIVREGVVRRRLFARRLFRRAEIARIGGKRVYAPGHYGADVHTEASVTTVVLDRAGKVLFRVGPWTRGRRRLARLLREWTREESGRPPVRGRGQRGAGGAGDGTGR